MLYLIIVLGRAIALALASNGCKVIVNYASNEAAAAEVCSEIQSLYGIVYSTLLSSVVIMAIKVTREH